MLTDVRAGRARADRFELTANLHGRVRLQIEALMLRESAGEEDVDHRLRAWLSHIWCRERLKRRQMIHT